MSLKTFLFWVATFVSAVFRATVLNTSRISKLDVRDTQNVARKIVVAILLAATANEMTHHAEPHVDKEIHFTLHWPGLGCKQRGCIFHQQHLEDDTDGE